MSQVVKPKVIQIDEEATMTTTERQFNHGQGCNGFKCKKVVDNANRNTAIQLFKSSGGKTRLKLQQKLAKKKMMEEEED